MISGNEAINKPAAGIGTPRNPSFWLVLILNLAKRQAPAAVKIKAGIKAILNFAPAQLSVPDDVELRTVNMAMELEALTFALSNRDR